MASFNLSYDDESEYLSRKALFQETQSIIDTINAQTGNTFTVGNNAISTMTDAEKSML